MALEFKIKAIIAPLIHSKLIISQFSKGVKEINNYPQSLIDSFAQKLDQPICTEVEFIFPTSKDQKPRRLYAMSKILMDRSQYFKRSIMDIGHYSDLALNSGFSEGRRRPSKRSSSGEEVSSQVPRQVVTITDDYDLFRALLFYLYTDKICFSASPDKFHDEFGTCLFVSDGEAMYALAHRLLFHSITSKALTFIRSTCNNHMITSSVFGSFGSIHSAVGKIYDDYFMANWNEVIKTPEFENYFQELEEDSAEFAYANKKFRSMVRRHEQSLSVMKK